MKRQFPPLPKVLSFKTHQLKSLKLLKSPKRLRELSVILVFLVLFLVSAFFLLKTPTLAAWFNDSWGFRKAVALTNSSGGTLTDYQVSFTLDTTTLITTGKMQSTCADLRITDINGKTLPLWLEEGGVGACNLSTTNIWTKIPTLETSGRTIYVYYGNPSAVSVANGSNVFQTFDTFNGSAVDGSRWTTTGSPTVSGGAVSLVNGAGLISTTTQTDANGLGRMIFRAKQANTATSYAKVGFSNTSSASSNFHADDASAFIIGSTEETVNTVASTNLVSHHQLEETTTTDANQFKPSGYFDTGKLSQAVSMYGNAAGTTGSTLTFNRGAQISGNNYEHFNSNQGTISFWFKPSWAGNDNLQHFFFEGALNTRWSIYKDSNNSLYVIDGSGSPIITYTASGWVANAWHLITFRWDADNTLDGTNYGTLYIDGSSAANRTSAITTYAPNTNLTIGHRATGVSQAQALIDDFAIFDRVLGTAEISSIYNAGSGAEAGLIADSSLKFYAKMNGSGTLSPVTYNAGANSDWTAYNSSTNTNGTMLLNGLMESATAGAPDSWTAIASPTLADAEAASIFADIRSQKITNTAANDGLSQTVSSLTAGDDLYVSAWVKSDGTNAVKLAVQKGSDSSEITSLTSTSTSWTRLDFAVEVPAAETSVKVALSAAGTTTAWYVDNIRLTKNLVDNGGMEGGANPPAGWTQETNATVTSDTSPHSGTNELKVVAGAATVGAKQSITLVSGNNYLVSGWARATSGDTATLSVDTGAGSTSILASTTSTSYTRLSGVFKAAGTAGVVYLRASANTDIVWFDDVSITPLDSVATSFQAWTPVVDAKSGNPNPLSVQGALTGVASTTSGARNNAYTFDGSTGYLRQKTYLSNIGNLSYSGNTLTDSGQTFTSYKSASSPATAPYMIVVTNSDNTTSWGYIGNAAEGATVVTVYTTKATTTAGWNGTSPVGKTPVGYEVRKTDYQITGNLTVGAWVKTSSTSAIGIMGKWRSGDTNFGLFYSPNGAPTFGVSNNGTVIKSVIGATGYNDGNWHFITGVYTTSTSVAVFVDGVLANQDTSSVYSSLFDSNLPLGIAAYNGLSDVGNKWNGSLDSPFVISTALTQSQIQDIYNSTASHYGLTTNNAVVNTQPANTSTPTTDANVYHTYALTSLTASTTLSQDSTTIATSTTNLPNSASYARIQNADATNSLTLDWVAIAKGAGNTTSQTVSATEEKGTAPVAWWKFDEGYGTTTNNSGSQGASFNGTLGVGSSAPSWATEDMCISGKCLKFDGNDYVSVGSTIPTVNSVSFWIKPTTNTASMINLTSTSYITSTSGTITATGFTTPAFYINGLLTSTPTLTANSWNHIVVTTATAITANAVTIGKANSAYTTGFIDDVKIYAYARTAPQVKTDYAAGKASSATNKGSSASLGSPPGAGGMLSNGLVGYWKMDEASWNGTVNEVVDSSGNSNHMNAKNSVSTTTGKFGNAGNFTAASTHYLCTNTDGDTACEDNDNLDFGTGNFTLSAWVKSSSIITLGVISAKGSPTSDGGGPSYGLYSSDTGNVGFTVDASSGAGDRDSVTASTTGIINGNWHLVTATRDNQYMRVYIDGILKATGANNGRNVNSTNPLYISNTSYAWNGQIDEVRIYNRAFSPAEVTQLYNFAPGPKIQLKMDEGAGTAAQDSSGNSNTGTLNDGALWSTGKYGRGIKLDGTNDDVSVGDFGY